MENRNGNIYLWNGQDIINYQPRNFEHTIITKADRQKHFARIVHITGKLSRRKKINNFLITDHIYLLGGKLADQGPTNKVECYSLRHNIWRRVPAMQDNRMCHSAVAAVDDTIVVCGGLHSNGDTPSCEIFSSSYQRYIFHHIYS